MLRMKTVFVSGISPDYTLFRLQAGISIAAVTALVAYGNTRLMVFILTCNILLIIITHHAYNYRHYDTCS